VVTLTGPGGIGKSRLALRAAHQLGRFSPDGAWLAGLDGPDLVPYVLARSLGCLSSLTTASRTRWWPSS